jgi:hypothetical protein
MRGLRPKGRLWASAAVLLGGLTVAAWGQAYTPVTIVVTGPDGASVAGAEVRVSPGSPSGDHFVADEQGRVQVGMTPGEYQVHVSAQGFGTAEQKVSVEDKALTVTVALKAAAASSNVQDVSGPTPMAPGAVALDTGGGNSGSGAAASVLTITAGPGERGVFTPATLKNYPHQKVTVMDPKTKQARVYSGVPVMDLLSHLGVTGNLMGPALAKYVVATGSDGFAAVLSLAEVDPKLHGGTVMIADSMDGKPLDAKAGPFRLVVSEDKMPARSVRNLVSIELRSVE